MSEKRRGLGRGLGALIPPGVSVTRPNRPVNVFFPGLHEGEERAQEPGPTDVPSDPDVSRETSDLLRQFLCFRACSALGRQIFA